MSFAPDAETIIPIPADIPPPPQITPRVSRLRPLSTGPTEDLPPPPPPPEKFARITDPLPGDTGKMVLPTAEQIAEAKAAAPAESRPRRGRGWRHRSKAAEAAPTPPVVESPAPVDEPAPAAETAPLPVVESTPAVEPVATTEAPDPTPDSPDATAPVDGDVTEPVEEPVAESAPVEEPAEEPVTETAPVDVAPADEPATDDATAAVDGADEVETPTEDEAPGADAEVDQHSADPSESDAAAEAESAPVDDTTDDTVVATGATDPEATAPIAVVEPVAEPDDTTDDTTDEAVETPVAEAPEAPVAEDPVVETPVAEAPPADEVPAVDPAAAAEAASPAPVTPPGARVFGTIPSLSELSARRARAAFDEGRHSLDRPTAEIPTAGEIAARADRPGHRPGDTAPQPVVRAGLPPTTPRDDATVSGGDEPPARRRGPALLVAVLVLLVAVVGGGTALALTMGGDSPAAGPTKGGTTTKAPEEPADPTPTGEPGAPELDTQVPLENVACDDEYIVEVDQLLDPETYLSRLDELGDVEGLKYLQASESCSTYGARTGDDEWRYVAFTGPFATLEEACAARTASDEIMAVPHLMSADQKGRSFCNCSDTLEAPTLQRGSGAATAPFEERAWVSEAQQMLQVFGYFDRPVVGDPFGPSTQTAVQDFQRDEGLPVTGVIGPETWTRLQTKETDGRTLC